MNDDARMIKRIGAELVPTLPEMIEGALEEKLDAKAQVIAAATTRTLLLMLMLAADPKLTIEEASDTLQDALAVNYILHDLRNLGLKTEQS